MDNHGYGGWCLTKYDFEHWIECEKECFYGPINDPSSKFCRCENPHCTIEHYVKRGFTNPHEAVHSGQGMNKVINIINGGFDCCP